MNIQILLCECTGTVFCIWHDDGSGWLFKKKSITMHSNMNIKCVKNLSWLLRISHSGVCLHTDLFKTICK